MKRLLIMIICCCAMVCTQVRAQQDTLNIEPSKSWFELSVGFSGFQYRNVNDLFSPDNLSRNAMLQLAYRYAYSKRWSFEFNFQYTNLDNVENRFNQSYFGGSFLAKYYIPLANKFDFSLGTGFSVIDLNQNTGEYELPRVGSLAAVPVQAGFTYRPTENLELSLKATYQRPINDLPDVMLYGIGVGFRLNRQKKEEASQPMKKDLGDSINALIDEALKRQLDALDFDKDGIPNLSDECPNIPGPKENKGCPIENDRDGDGVPDEIDQCPDVYGTNSYGCPDDDYDGIFNDVDQCPLVHGKGNDTGCPDSTDIIKVINLILASKQINYSSNKYDIPLAAQPYFQRLADILNENRGVKLVIMGHTDAVGTEEYNYGLASRRAMALKEYLIKIGVEPTRIGTEQFGEDLPLAPNRTEAGRAINRRIELKLIKKE